MRIILTIPTYPSHLTFFLSDKLSYIRNICHGNINKILIMSIFFLDSN